MPYVGEIRIFAGNFAPVGWMFCEGQLLPISENEPLFQLIGTTYGGDGEETFALPDLRGRVPIHMGARPGGSTYTLAETGGQEYVSLTVSQIPGHNHLVAGTAVPGKVFAYAQGARTGTSADPSLASYPAMLPDLKQYAKAATADKFSKPLLTDFNTPATGGNQPHNNMQPYLCVNFIISLFGVFPSQT